MIDLIKRLVPLVVFQALIASRLMNGGGGLEKEKVGPDGKAPAIWAVPRAGICTLTRSVDLRSLEPEAPVRTSSVPGPRACGTVDISGTWDATEHMTGSCVIDGQTQPVSADGTGKVNIQQSGCNISYTLSGFNRSGTISGNTLTISGPLLAPQAGFTYTTNSMTAQGTISDREIRLSGQGSVSGTACDSTGCSTFSCRTTSDTATLTRPAPCTISCTASVNRVEDMTAYFKSSVTASNCAGSVTYKWTFGDGQTSAAQSPSHVYTSAGTYPWEMTSTVAGVSCTAQKGTVTVSAPKCLPVGSLRICAESMTQSGSTYIFKGRPNINDTVWFSDDLTYSATSPTVGKISTQGTVAVGTASSSKSVLGTGPVSLDVDGPASRLMPVPALASYALTLSGIPLRVAGGSIVVRSDGVDIDPVVTFGTDGFSLADAKLSVRILKASQEIQLTGASLVSGSGTLNLRPLLTVDSLSLQYDSRTDKLSGTAALSFPNLDKAKSWGLQAGIVVKPGCLEAFEITVGLPRAIPLGPPPANVQIRSMTLVVEGLCAPPKLSIFLGGDWNLSQVPTDIFHVTGSRLGYQAPSTLTLESGQLEFLGTRFADLEATVTLSPAEVRFTGNASFNDVFKVRTGISASFPSSSFAGNAEGTIQIPDLDCGSDLACPAIKKLIEIFLGPLPYQVANANATVLASSIPESGFEGSVRGSVALLGSLGVTVEARYRNRVFQTRLGQNFDQLFSPPRSQVLAASEQTVTLADGDDVTFVAIGKAASPAPQAYLRTPASQTITPETAPGTTDIYYKAHGQDALFRVKGAKSGPWTFGVTNLASSQVDLAALRLLPPPTVTFKQVTITGRNVRITASVAPQTASPSPAVAFFYSRSSQAKAGAIALSWQPVTSGNIDRTWDASGLPPGTYYLYAIADDGRNVPPIAAYGSPITFEGTLKAPTNLKVERLGRNASISWTAPVAPSISGHVIRYVDLSTAYETEAAVLSGTSTTIDSLDPARSYQFGVAAYDTAGVLGPQSETVFAEGNPTLELCGAAVAVTVTYRNQYTGQTGVARPLPQGANFGYFYFSSENNPEVFIKVLDFGSASPYLLFYAGLTDFEYTVTFQNRATGKTLSFTKAAGSFAGGADNTGLPHGIARAVLWSRDGSEWNDVPADMCLPGPPQLSPSNPPAPSGTTTSPSRSLPAGRVTGLKPRTTAADELLLSQGRVAVSVRFQNQYSGQTGTGKPLPQRDEFGYFYFSDAGNPEVFVKVLDFGTDKPYLLFYAGLTDFEYAVTFRNTATGQTVSFKKDAGTFNGGADNTSLRH